MNTLGLTLIWSAIQATLVAVVAILAYASAARRGPGAASIIAAGHLGITVLLTGLAFCPLPSWWRWGTHTPDRMTSPPQRRDHVDGPPEASQGSIHATDTVPPVTTSTTDTAFGLSWSLLDRVWQHLEQASTSSADREWRWPATLSLLFLLGSGFGCLRLAIGMWAIVRLRRRSVPIDDPRLTAVLRQLQTLMRYPHRVAMRESAELATAATLGW